jgi:hypothetical protein
MLEGDTLIVNSTFSANRAHTGGGIFSDGQILTARLCTLSGNVATDAMGTPYAGIHAMAGSNTRVDATIVANSSGGAHCNAADIFDLHPGSSFGCDGAEVTNLDTVLRDNGGPTRTHYLNGTSNAVEAGGDCGIEVDQRGVKRRGQCDSGAFEYGICDDLVLSDTAISNAQTHTGCEYFWLGPQLTRLPGPAEISPPAPVKW